MQKKVTLHKINLLNPWSGMISIYTVSRSSSPKQETEGSNEGNKPYSHVAEKDTNKREIKKNNKTKSNYLYFIIVCTIITTTH